MPADLRAADNQRAGGLAPLEPGEPRQYSADLTQAAADAWNMSLMGQWGGVALAMAVGEAQPHISYLDATTNTLAWAHMEGALWLIETVDTGGNVGVQSSLGLDNADLPHVSYFGRDQGPIYYAHHDGLSWHTEVLDPAYTYTGWRDSTSLAIDATDRPHVAYGRYGLRYSFHDGVEWYTETVDPAGGAFASLVLDVGGHPHVSYHVAADESLRYAYHDGSSWHIETVDDGLGWWTNYTSLALDTAGRPHIAYFDDTLADLKYAYYDGVEWHTETVDSDEAAGFSPSLALSATDLPHISYFHYGASGTELRYARHTGTVWQITAIEQSSSGSTMDETGRPDRNIRDSPLVFTSLALDAGGLPHISYYDGWYAGYLRYTFFDGSMWFFETVDADLGGYGGQPSLALDSTDQPHISYYDYSLGDLLHAYRIGAAFRRYLPLVMRNW